MDVTLNCLHGSVLGGVRHDGRDRREGGSRPLPASVCAVAGGASVVPVCPRRRPRAFCAQHHRTAGCAGIVSRAWCPAPAAVLALLVCLRIFPWRSAGRRAWLARVCAAPAAVAAWSPAREPDPRSPLGLVAPAAVLYALE